MCWVKLIAALAVTGAAAGCAPHPIVARDPVPAPAGESYVCDSRPTVLNAFKTDCEPRWRERNVVVRAAG